MDLLFKRTKIIYNFNSFQKYATNFENEKIGIKELPYLTEERLQKMGIPMGPRIRILQEAHACCQQNQYKVYIV